MSEIEERISDLEELVAELLPLVARQPVAVPFPMPRWNWTNLSSYNAIAERTDLAEWVAWLTETYDLLDRWPVCWHEHSDVVMWVLALRTWHRAVYAPELEVAVDQKDLEHATDVATQEASPRTYWEWHTMALRPFLTDILPSMTKRCAAVHVELSAEMQRHHEDHRTALQNGVHEFAGPARTPAWL